MYKIISKLGNVIAMAFYDRFISVNSNLSLMQRISLLNDPIVSLHIEYEAIKLSRRFQNLSMETKQTQRKSSSKKCPTFWIFISIRFIFANSLCYPQTNKLNFMDRPSKIKISRRYIGVKFD